jgi:hypothetical protein
MWRISIAAFIINQLGLLHILEILIRRGWLQLSFLGERNALSLSTNLVSCSLSPYKFLRRRIFEGTWCCLKEFRNLSVSACKECSRSLFVLWTCLKLCFILSWTWGDFCAKFSLSVSDVRYDIYFLARAYRPVSWSFLDRINVWQIIWRAGLEY